MTPRDFCYWLQGFIELTAKSYAPNDEQSYDGFVARTDAQFRAEYEEVTA